MSDEPIDTFRPEEEERLCRNLVTLSIEVERGAFSSGRITCDLCQELHRRVWTGVRPYAGKTRQRGYGPETLIILGRSAPHRDGVPGKLAELLNRIEREARGIGISDEQSMLAAIVFAVEAHVDLIRLQPFIDGNKRTARLILNILLVRFGLNGVTFRIPRLEYVDALTQALGGNSRPMVDLVISLTSDRVSDVDADPDAVP